MAGMTGGLIILAVWVICGAACTYAEMYAGKRTAMVTAMACGLIIGITAAHAENPTRAQYQDDDNDGRGAYVSETITGTPQPGHWMGSPATKSLTFSKDMQTMVTIKADGTVVYGEGYKPDDIAKALWDAVGVERKARNCQ